MVCIACSQLEKLRANLLDIRQKHVTSEQDSGAETDREEGGKVQTSQEVFCRMQGQLNDCVRLHQLIIE
jgi:septum formation topological specificity factor MinE